MPDLRHPIDISVVTTYLPEQSVPEQDQYSFAYQVTIRNRGYQAVRLLTRYWLITDGDGHPQEVRGVGVVGQQPLIEAGDQYVYTSSAVLPTRVGSMQGAYQMETEDGRRFDAPITPFRLAMPGALH